MFKSKPGRPGAQNQYFFNKTLLGNEHFEVQPARSSKSAFFNSRFTKKLSKSALSRPGSEIDHFLNKALIENAQI